MRKLRNYCGGGFDINTRVKAAAVTILYYMCPNKFWEFEGRNVNKLSRLFVKYHQNVAKFFFGFSNCTKNRPIEGNFREFFAFCDFNMFFVYCWSRDFFLPWVLESSSSTLPKTLLANSLHLKDRGIFLLAPCASSASEFWLIGEECLLEDTEETLRRNPKVELCRRLKKAKAIELLRSKPELALLRGFWACVSSVASEALEAEALELISIQCQVLLQP